jgi:NDP-sugar pyrophosphorylase family protein
MLKIGGKPILEIIVEGLQKQSFKNIFISVNYKSSQIKDYFGDGNGYGVTIRYIDEENALGTAGAISLLPEKPDIPFIVINGDLFSNVNFASIVDFHDEHEGDMTVCVKKYDFEVPYGVLNVENYLIKSIEEKPVYNFFVNSGIYCLAPVCVDFIPNNEFFDMTSLLKQIKKNGMKVCAFPIVEYWLDVGRHSDFEKANTDSFNMGINR